MKIEFFTKFIIVHEITKPQFTKIKTIMNRMNIEIINLKEYIVLPANYDVILALHELGDDIVIKGSITYSNTNLKINYYQTKTEILCQTDEEACLIEKEVLEKCNMFYFRKGNTLTYLAGNDCLVIPLLSNYFNLIVTNMEEK